MCAFDGDGAAVSIVVGRARAFLKSLLHVGRLGIWDCSDRKTLARL